MKNFLKLQRSNSRLRQARGVMLNNKKKKIKKWLKH